MYAKHRKLNHYLDQFNFSVLHSYSNPNKRIKIKIIIVTFILVLKLEKEKGKIKEISISKIKNRIITKKNCIEKLL